MEQDKFFQAERLYMQTDLTKSEIAEILGISRTTVYNWWRENEWDRLRRSAEVMPRMLTENMVLIIGKVQGEILDEHKAFDRVSLEQARILSMMVSSHKKLNTRTTLNEALELKGDFMTYLKDQDPEIAESVDPFFNNFLRARAKEQPSQYLSNRVNEYGGLKPKVKNTRETQLDVEEVVKEMESTSGKNNPNPGDSNTPDPVTPKTPDNTPTGQNITQTHPSTIKPSTTPTPLKMPNRSKPRINEHHKKLSRAERKALQRFRNLHADILNEE